MSFFDIFKVGTIKAENERLQQIINTFSELDGSNNIEKFQDLKNKSESIEIKIETNKRENELLNYEIIRKKDELLALDDEISLESFALYKPQFEFTNSEEYKKRLQEIRTAQKEMIRSKTAAYGSSNFTMNNKKSEGKKVIDNMVKLVLRSFNNECDYCVDNVKFNNIHLHKARIEKSFDALNKLAEIMTIKIRPDYRNLKLDELSLAFEYQQKKQEEKEEQKRIREELREQARLEQEIKQARVKIEKERKHHEKALSELHKMLNTGLSEIEIQEINNKIIEINNNLENLKKEESVVDYREKNAKAGYVYIISNIGSFGEGVYKIGMTRRLEPMDRVDELGDASVPFAFDVHALIFSDNAPDLENKLHQHFFKNRLNKINNRKEFFKADIKEIEKVIKENYDKIVDLIEFAPAEQYRESLLIEK